MTSGGGLEDITPEEAQRIRDNVMAEYDKMMAEKKAAEEKKEEN